MKITKIAFALSFAAALALTSCASNKSPVTRVDSETVLDLSGNWNDTDIGIVCKSLIAEASNSPRIAKFEAENGRPPVVILGRIRNDSSEPADVIHTDIIAKKMENALVNSGVFDFVADAGDREALRAERLAQIDFTNPETAAAIGNETGADLMLVGSVKTSIEKSADGKTESRHYYVYIQMQHLSTNKLWFSGENDEIKKVIKR
ncbi:MAG: penicillin-binding protein activator LpoB [Spirochaetaceae bacterium]|nr:penicillin-binding protein activator LpoB [Spirochaetaceae bacterium]